MKKALCLLLSFVMIMSLATSISAGVTADTVVCASADEASPDSEVPQDYTQSGTCGDNAFWYYYEDTKTLIISGEGKIKEESYNKGPQFKDLPFEKATVLEGITELGDNAFRYCESLKEINLPDSLIKINSYVFYDCKNLTSLTIPKNVNLIGIGLFYGCDSLTELNVATENTTFDSRDNCNAVILTEINCLKLAIKTSTFPESVTSIAGGAYTGAPGIVEVVMPDTITELHGEPFLACKELESVVLSKSLSEVGLSLFADNTSLKSVTIPDGVSKLEPFCFMRCESLDNVTIPGSAKTIGQSAFSDCKSLKNLTIENGVETLGMAAFARCTSLETLEVPASVKDLGDITFRGCSSLESIVIYNKECRIGDYADTIPEHTVIYGYEGSTAQEYAEHYVREFVALPEPEYEIGDVDMDGFVSIMDATEIQLYIAQLVEWKSEKCEQLADVDGDSSVSIMDATAIQLKLAGLYE